ncbi:hypothetical protein OEZ85_009605 [Tetradesmus obliquus]|uniref:Myb-like domain-containing protein n=1 Tax=Tetradesmus obliquus TaxID=3088 RepID=A0ABY8U9H4_TETOB|nr:hypothetical protein OEZ85_009605 [Tetradesmus obliquus]
MASPGAAADQTGTVQTGQQHVDQQHASQPHQPQQQQQQQQQHEADPRQQQADHPQQQQQQHAGDPQQQRRDYAMHMRRLFSPPGMLHPDGSINQEFFRPKKVVTLTDKRWGDAEREALYAGLAKHGIGRWRDIGQDMLPGWDDHSIRIKAAKLLGCQNLSWYYGRRFSRVEAQAEFEKNQQLGAVTGCWKNGMLVDDERGTLKAHFTAAHQQQQQQQQQKLGGDASAAASVADGEAAEVQAGSAEGMV